MDKGRAIYRKRSISGYNIQHLYGAASTASMYHRRSKRHRFDCNCRPPHLDIPLSMMNMDLLVVVGLALVIDIVVVLNVAGLAP